MFCKVKLFFGNGCAFFTVMKKMFTFAITFNYKQFTK